MGRPAPQAGRLDAGNHETAGAGENVPGPVVAAGFQGKGAGGRQKGWGPVFHRTEAMPFARPSAGRFNGCLKKIERLGYGGLCYRPKLFHISPDGAGNSQGLQLL